MSEHQGQDPESSGVLAEDDLIRPVSRRSDPFEDSDITEPFASEPGQAEAKSSKDAPTSKKKKKKKTEADPFASDPFEGSDIGAVEPAPLEEDPFAEVAEVKKEEKKAKKEKKKKAKKVDPFADDPFEGKDADALPAPEPSDIGEDPFSDVAEPAAKKTEETAKKDEKKAEPAAKKDQKGKKAKKKAKKPKKEEDVDPFADDPFEGKDADALPTPEPSDVGENPFAEAEEETEPSKGLDETDEIQRPKSLEETDEVERPKSLEETDEAEVSKENTAEKDEESKAEPESTEDEPTAEAKPKPRSRSRRPSTRIPRAAARAMSARPGGRDSARLKRKKKTDEDEAPKKSDEDAPAETDSAGPEDEDYVLNLDDVKVDADAEVIPNLDADEPERKRPRTKTRRMDPIEGEEPPQIKARPRTKTRRLDPVDADGRPARRDDSGRPKVVLPPPAVRAESEGESRIDSRSRAEDPPLPSKKPVAALAVVCLVGVVTFAVGGLHYQEAQHMAQKKADFLGQAEDFPKRALLAYEGLPPEVRADPDVAAAVEELREGIAREEAREQASQVLRDLPHAKGAADRLAICDAALEADPSCAEAYVERARIKARLARLQATPGEEEFTALEEALADLHSAIRVDSSFAEGYLARGLLFEALDNEQAALGDLEKAAELGKRSAVGVLARAHLASRAGTLDEAEKLFARGARKARKAQLKAEAWLGTARVQLRQGESQRAWEAAVEARKRDPESSEAHLLLAEARQRLEPDREASLKDLARAIELDPWNLRASAMQAWLLLDRQPEGTLAAGTKRLEEARKLALLALGEESRNPLAELVLGQLAVHGGNLTEAKRHTAAAREATGPERVDALVLSAQVRQLEAGRLDEPSKAWLEEALKLQPQHVLGLTLRARARADDGDTPGALDDLDAALVSGPALPDAFILRARLNLTRKPSPLRRVIADLTQTLRLDGARGEVYLLRARARYRAGRLRDALADLEKAEREGKAARHAVALLRGHCHYTRGHWKSARQAYTTYLQLRSSAPERSDLQERIARCDRHLSGEIREF